MPIQRKKKATKRRNPCLPCNPSTRATRFSRIKRNPGEKKDPSDLVHIARYIDIHDLPRNMQLEVEERDYTYGDVNLSLVLALDVLSGTSLNELRNEGFFVRELYIKL